MAIRTTNTLVKEIIQTALSDTEIDAMINHSSLMVDEKLTGAGLTDEVLTEIETWLTAHIIATTKERQTLNEKVGEVSVRYKTNPAGFFEQTTYGQYVLFLDTSGQLQAAGKKKAWIKAIKQDTSGTSLTDLDNN